MPLTYTLVFAWHVRRAFLQMQGKPYASVKAANIRLWVVVRVLMLLLWIPRCQLSDIAHCISTLTVVGWLTVFHG